LSGSAEAFAREILGDLREDRSFRLIDGIGTDLDLAYRVQDVVTEQLLGLRGERKIGGYKLAFNKQASFDYYGISEPCSAPAFSDGVVISGTELSLSNYRQLVIEPEIAVVLGHDLPGNGVVTREQVGQAISHVTAAFELLDVRDAFKLDPSAAQAVAQGVYNVGAVLGSTRFDLQVLDLTTLPVCLRLGKGEVLQAVGTAPQHPVDAVHWLANHLARRGKTLEAGMIVLCGTHLPAQTIAQPGDISLEMGPLGRVDVTVT
jgi:2-keto-4-pentenoate hydratase